MISIYKYSMDIKGIIQNKCMFNGVPYLIYIWDLNKLLMLIKW